MANCIFCKIVAGEVPAKKVYEDQDILAFHDINPAAPVHFLIIPKKHIPTLFDITEQDISLMGKIMAIAGRLAKQEGCLDGFRTIVNTGRVGCQEVYHVHIHILGADAPLGLMLSKK